MTPADSGTSRFRSTGHWTVRVGALGDRERAQRPLAKVKVMTAVSSTGCPRVALELVAWTRNDGPRQRQQVVDLVDQVPQDRPAAGFAVPAVTDLEIFVILVEERAVPTSTTILPSAPLWMISRLLLMMGM